ncbi:cellulose biosynthesis cyclic di-GMP-binding regulatory protein BcsB [Pseudomonas sp. KSR10]|uniref:Cyclic di-GMP-binding protein n=1 Tax=Stutzerimonas stutzeri TaxID=316 RepID=A0A0D9AF93_STUST|nr:MULTISPECIES: cellulose biosynthesis cyclic di-GMP-binding regulatory protein BcsB [Pseudomonadaceae]KJH79673.1 cellulose synthase [Stutzerimonas stutzeri]MCG6541294.1 cellulose biosynthesis cyclic di-GMP-binding regulatory protein BcsB [Pseudomonas sp. KSR10]
MNTQTHSWTLLTTLLWALTAVASTEPSVDVDIAPPSWDSSRSFSDLGRPRDQLLLGIRNAEQIEFRLRHDRIATDATLHLDYTPSPALLPVLSHLRIYLNDELMGTLPITKEQIGQRVSKDLALDPHLLGDFNRVRVEFVGHYSDICEDPAHSGLWLNLGRQSRVSLHEQALDIAGDLAWFPQPFFDERDSQPLNLPVVFSGAPTPNEQRAAGILASYFGGLAAWRGASFPVLFDALPSTTARPQPTVVFATNSRRPSFLAEHPEVDGPTVELIEHPEDRYSKLLLIFGRDDNDLIVVASALAMDNGQLRGNRVRMERMEPPARVPYDAPNWIRTDRAVQLSELIDYPQQLQVSGLQPYPITLDVNLPPDLFVWRNQGIPLQTRYRYTPPTTTDESRLNISVNDQYITSIALQGSDSRSGVENVRLSVLSSDSTTESEKLLVPALKMGIRNKVRFEFNFASKLGNAQRDRCQTYLPTNIQAAIDEQSSIDLSGYYHYMAMPDLKAFSRSGFPFSRMADLSETLVLVPSQPNQEQVGTLLDTLALIGSQTGYPAYGVRITDDWKMAEQVDADLLLIGPLPQQLADGATLPILLESPRSWLQNGGGGPTIEPANGNLGMTANGPLAAVVGLQSPFHTQRSLVALLASAPQDYALLRDALTDSGKQEAFAGAIALIRNSGVSSHFVGDQYYVGDLPWWLLLWFHLSSHPVLLAFLAAASIVLFAIVLWRALSWAARRRLADAE